MEIERVHPQLRQMVQRAPKVDIGSRFMRHVARFGSRYLLPRAKTAGVSVHNVRAGTVRLRLYIPQQRTGAGLVWIHGGGMVIGAPQQDDLLCAATAAQLGIVIASADYRMAPEHPYPTPQHDCLEVWNWTQHNAEKLGLDHERIAVGGASAGGGLAASLVNTLHDSGDVQPLAQWLLYPMLDDRTAADRTLDSIDHYIWNNTANRIGWTALLRGTTTPGAHNVPADASPARRSHTGSLPRTWIGVGDIDLFHHEDTTYARNLMSAGTPVDLTVLAGAPHGFENLARDTPIVRDFIDDAQQWLARAVQTR